MKFKEIKLNKNKIVLYVLITCLLLIVVGIILFKAMGSGSVDEMPEINQREISKLSAKADRKARLLARKRRLRSKKRSVDSRISEGKGLVEVDAISDQISRMDDSNAKIDLLNELWDVDNPALPKLVLEQLDDKNKGVRLAAIELLDNKTEGEILSCIDKALDDPDETVREFAVILLADIDEKQKIQSLLLKGVGDSSENVRAATFDVLGDKSVGEQEDVYAQSINSPYADVKNSTIDMLTDIPSHKTIEILFRGLNDDNNDFRDMVNSKIHFFVSEEFDNYNDAIAWWEKNKDNFDEELFEK
jgi:HEAT repeat protein